MRKTRTDTILFDKWVKTSRGVPFIIHENAYNQKLKVAFVKWKLYGNLMSLKYINSPQRPKGRKGRL